MDRAMPIEEDSSAARRPTYGPVRRGDTLMPQAMGAEGVAATATGTEATQERVSELTEADVRDLSAKMVDLR
eukprot:8699779-Heterocapsa_arctica.AAC.1